MEKQTPPRCKFMVQEKNAKMPKRKMNKNIRAQNADAICFRLVRNKRKKCHNIYVARTLI
jgi:hypothetical protein